MSPRRGKPAPKQVGQPRSRRPPKEKGAAPRAEAAAQYQVRPDLHAGEKDQISGRFGTFAGVFRPTILTILGVMMYLREGWLVGNAGLGGALLIIVLCYAITGTTALSLSSIATNIRVGSGGVFSIATQSLGIEVGGSIGIPFYLAQGLSAAMYIYGFMEGWLKIFPGHSPQLVVAAVFLLVFAISYISASLAFRVQVVIMVGVIAALLSIVGGLYRLEVVQKPQLWGAFESAPFWVLFAVFFPASTGIMVGASMSGNLKDARRSIPQGTMAAWALSFVVYTGLAVWYSLVATPGELTSNLTVAVDRSLFGPLVLLGILSSCFTAALSSFVAAPRILQSLGEHRIVPFGSFVGALQKGEPRNAMLVTAALGLAALFLGDLNTIASVLTVFFLMTYFTINFIVVIEKKLNLVSFRPLFSVPWPVPLAGSLLSLASIVVVSPIMGLACVLASGGIYVYLDRRSLLNPHETLGSGLFVSIATWAAKRVTRDNSGRTLRSWKPDILIPVQRTVQFEGVYPLLRGIIQPQGSLHVVGIGKGGQGGPLRNLERVVTDVRRDGVFASWAQVESSRFAASLRTTVAVMQSSFFRPNILWAGIEDRSQRELDALIATAREHTLGMALVARHPELGLGRRRRINLWIREQSPHWELSFELANIDLPLLLALKLIQNWDARVNLITLVRSRADVTRATSYVHNLLLLGRIPASACRIHVEQTSMREYGSVAPRSDISFFGMGDRLSRKQCLETMRQAESTCIFIRDSGRESILV